MHLNSENEYLVVPGSVMRGTHENTYCYPSMAGIPGV